LLSWVMPVPGVIGTGSLDRSIGWTCRSSQSNRDLANGTLGWG